MIRCHCGYKGEGVSAYLRHKCNGSEPDRLKLEPAPGESPIPIVFQTPEPKGSRPQYGRHA